MWHDATSCSVILNSNISFNRCFRTTICTAKAKGLPLLGELLTDSVGVLEAESGQQVLGNCFSSTSASLQRHCTVMIQWQYDNILQYITIIFRYITIWQHMATYGNIWQNMPYIYVNMVYIYMIYIYIYIYTYYVHYIKSMNYLITLLSLSCWILLSPRLARKGPMVNVMRPPWDAWPAGDPRPDFDQFGVNGNRVNGVNTGSIYD